MFGCKAYKEQSSVLGIICPSDPTFRLLNNNEGAKPALLRGAERARRHAMVVGSAAM